MIMLKTKRTNLGRVIDDFFNDPFLETDSYLPTVTPDNIAISTGRSNLLEDDNSYRLEMQVPGLTKKDISITAERGHLNISSKSEDKFKVDNKTYIRRDFYNTELELDYRLPENVDMDNIKAKVENGILGIEVPKLVKNSNNKKEIKIS